MKKGLTNTNGDGKKLFWVSGEERFHIWSLYRACVCEDRTLREFLKSKEIREMKFGKRENIFKKGKKNRNK